MTKTCKACLRTLPEEDFLIQSGRRVVRCRLCHRAWKRKFHEGSRTTPMRAGEVPAGPFVAWVTLFTERAGYHDEAALLLGVNPRQLYRWIKRPMPFIEETTIDKVFCHVDQPHLLRELYPELYEGLAA